MKRKNCMKRKYMFMALLCYALTTAAQDASHNYVRTRSMLDETGGKYLDKVEYFDGLGRPFQTVLKKVTASSSNLVTLQEYDVAGRAANSWLPIVSSAEYVAPASFKSSAPGNYGNDSRPYGQPVYEASPLNRTVKEYGPGAAWHGGHSVNTDYLANSTANAQLNCINYSVSSAGALTSNGSYASGQLSVVKTTDEDLNVSYTFTDKMGHVVLSRQMKGSETHDTYYVYDDKSNLCFVLQPMYQSSANLDQYAFQYKYDGRNRCIWKKLPGAGYMEMVYDNADRLVFSQDGNQRALTSGNWTYYKYDGLNRLTEQGVCTNKVTTSGTTVHIRNYYDNYAFRAQAGFNNSNFPDDASGNGKGALTASVATVLGSSNKIYTAHYYDIKGRVVKTVQSNPLGGYDVATPCDKPFDPAAYRWLLIPDVALQKARLAPTYLQGRADIWSPNGYGFAAEKSEDTLGRWLEIERIEPYNPKQLKRELSGSRLTILKQDFPLTAAEIAARLGIREGGERRIAFTKIGQDYWTIRLK